jgi:DNA-3-methyladenine glycosylase I
MNAKWHAAHVLPRNANDRARLRWHLEHQKQCGCRPIPAGLLHLMKEAKTPGRAKTRQGAKKTAAHVTRGGVAKGARAAKGNRAANAIRAKSAPRMTRGPGRDAQAAKRPPVQRAHGARRKPGSVRPPSGSPQRGRSPIATGNLFAGPPGAAIRRRCGWAEGGDALYAQYHDEEWGRPSRDDRHLFEMLILEGAQAGLSWITILRKRENYRRAFDGFDPRKIAAYDARRIKKLLGDEGIVRNRLKIAAAVANAKAFLATQKEFGSFSRFLWDFVGGKPIVSRPASLADIAAHTDVSDAMSKALKKRGFKFVGSTICYAFMQATGLVNDHVAGCFLAAR